MLLAVPLAALAAAVFFSFSQSPYERYIGPILGPKSTRVSLLIPRGWKISKGPQDGYLSVEFVQAEPMRWLPGWAKRLLNLDNTSKTSNCLRVDWHPYPSERDGPWEAIWETGPGLEFCIAARNRYVPGSGNWTVSYIRSDKQALLSTYKTIFDSVKVL